jgi:xylan 1,4-beta-xylosidase
VTLTGDGAGGLVECWATRDRTGTVGVLLWNTTLDHGRVDGYPALDRDVEVHLSGLAARRYELRHYRIDAEHSNIAAVWRARSGATPPSDWPDEAGWEALRDADRLAELAPARTITVHNGAFELGFALPMPSVSYLELTEV